MPLNRRIFFHTCTIFGLSTPYGKSGVAVVRVSGPQSKQIFTSFTKSIAEPTTLRRVNIMDPENEELIDSAMAVFFTKPHSFTGEDVVEFHTHGSLAVISKLLSALGKQKHCRPASAGEFTQQAFFNGKLDLTGVEALADLLNAETDVQRQVSLSQLNGTISQLLSKWRVSLIKIIAQAEAVIDFGDDEEVDCTSETLSMLVALRAEIQSYLKDYRKGEIVRLGSKSSLFNYLVQRQASIVSNIPGTTRDLLQSTINLGGHAVQVFDTAGIHSGSLCPIEREGISRAVDQAKNSDFIVVVISIKEDPSFNGFHSWAETFFSDLTMQDLEAKTIILLNKADELNGTDEVAMLRSEWQRRFSGGVFFCSLSEARTENFDLDSFVSTLAKKARAPISNLESSVFFRERHRYHLRELLRFLDEAIGALKDEREIVIGSEWLRRGCRELEKITGQITTDQILDSLFKEFCIGK